MKQKITRNNLKGYNVYYCGYCELQDILQYLEPQAYNSGIYGWNYDAYYFGDAVICTGYRNLPGSRLKDIEGYVKCFRINKEIYNNSEDLKKLALSYINGIIKYNDALRG